MTLSSWREMLTCKSTKGPEFCLRVQWQSEGHACGWLCTHVCACECMCVSCACVLGEVGIWGWFILSGCSAEQEHCPGHLQVWFAGDLGVTFICDLWALITSAHVTVCPAQGTGWLFLAGESVLRLGEGKHHGRGRRRAWGEGWWWEVKQMMFYFWLWQVAWPLCASVSSSEK
jgi:hypothetical protein